MRHRRLRRTSLIRASVGLASALSLAGCYCSHGPLEDAGAPDAGAADAGPTSDAAVGPPAAESVIQVASTSAGALHVVRVSADGEVTLWGAPLSTAVPPVERVGRMLRAEDASRVLVQDNATGRTHALRAGRWVDVCAEWPSTNCYAIGGRPDLSQYIVVRGYRDTGPGPSESLMTYEGEELVAESGQRVAFSLAGWSVLSGATELTTLWDDGRRTTAERLEVELLRGALDERYLTVSRDYDAAWIRDPLSGDRFDLACADGSVPPLLFEGNSRWLRCGEEVVALTDDGFVDVGNVAPVESPRARVLYAAPGEYSVIVDAGSEGLAVSLQVFDPSGAEIAQERREFEATDDPAYARLLVAGQRFADDHFHVYLSFQHYQIAHDDLLLERQDGILAWDREAGARWFPLDAGDVRASSVWFPESRDRAFWVTQDGRLLSYDVARGALDDFSEDLTFEGYY